MDKVTLEPFFPADDGERESDTHTHTHTARTQSRMRMKMSGASDGKTSNRMQFNQSTALSIQHLSIIAHRSELTDPKRPELSQLLSFSLWFFVCPVASGLHLRRKKRPFVHVNEQ